MMLNKSAAAIVVTTGTLSTILITKLYCSSHPYFRRFFCSQRNEKEENKDDISELVMNVIATRRSIFPKDYDQERKVPKHIIEKMLECANWAPSHGKTEPWRFIIFSGDALERLGTFEAELYQKKTSKEKFSEAKMKKKKNSKLQSSYVIAICMQRQKSQAIPEMEEIEAVACAVQNMHLCATAHQVGAYWSSGNLIYSKEMKDFLGLENENDKCLGLFYVGYSKKKHPQGQRESIGEKIKWIEQ